MQSDNLIYYTYVAWKDIESLKEHLKGEVSLSSHIYVNMPGALSVSSDACPGSIIPHCLVVLTAWLSRMYHTVHTPAFQMGKRYAKEGSLVF